MVFALEVLLGMFTVQILPVWLYNVSGDVPDLFLIWVKCKSGSDAADPYCLVCHKPELSIFSGPLHLASFCFYFFFLQYLVGISLCMYRSGISQCI